MTKESGLNFVEPVLCGTGGELLATSGPQGLSTHPGRYHMIELKATSSWKDYAKHVLHGKVKPENVDVLLDSFYAASMHPMFENGRMGRLVAEQLAHFKFACGSHPTDSLVSACRLAVAKYAQLNGLKKLTPEERKVFSNVAHFQIHRTEMKQEMEKDKMKRMKTVLKQEMKETERVVKQDMEKEIEQKFQPYALGNPWCDGKLLDLTPTSARPGPLSDDEVNAVAKHW